MCCPFGTETHNRPGRSKNDACLERIQTYLEHDPAPSLFSNTGGRNGSEKPVAFFSCHRRLSAECLYRAKNVSPKQHQKLISRNDFRAVVERRVFVRMMEDELRSGHRSHTSIGWIRLIVTPSLRDRYRDVSDATTKANGKENKMRRFPRPSCDEGFLVRLPKTASGMVLPVVGCSAHNQKIIMSSERRVYQS